MSTDEKVSLDEAKAMKKAVRDARALTLKNLAKMNVELQRIIVMIADAHETLREIDSIETESSAKVALDRASAGHRLDPKARKALVRTDGSATDFVFSVIGLTDGGANTTDLQKVATEMGADFTIGALHAAVHRLVGSGLIMKTGTKKGAPYRLTRTGADEWTLSIRRLKVSEE